MADVRKIHPQAGMDSKLADLTDFEFRVWWQYISAANDLGVMPALASVLQAGNRRLSALPAKRVQVALNRIIEIGLLHVFVHDGMPYCWNWKWQDWQQIRYPRQSALPMPPPADLAKASALTQKLFAQVAEMSPQHFGKVSETLPEDLAVTPHPTRARTSRGCAPNPNPPPNPDPRLGLKGGAGENEPPVSDVDPVWETRRANHSHGLAASHAGCFAATPAACARGICLPAWLGREWRQQYGDDTAAADDAIRAMVDAALATLPSGPIGDEPKVFWRAVWRKSHGSAAPVVEVARSAGGRRLSAVESNFAGLREDFAAFESETFPLPPALEEA